MKTWWSLSAAIALAVLLAVIATVPPRPRSQGAPQDVFSAARAMADVRALGRTPHPTGSDAQGDVRARLVARLSALGAEVRVAAYPISRLGAERIAAWSGRPAPAEIFDVVAVVPGADRVAPAVLLMAHYDTVWASPGAADDTAGVAAALEILRALKAGPAPARDLVVLFTDGEEIGLEGSRAFFRADPARLHVRAVVNLEARGGGGRAAMFETGRGDGEMMRLFAQAVRRPDASSLSSFVYALLPNDTDFTPAKTKGLVGVNFAFIGRPELYHSPQATPERLDQGALQDIGEQALDVVRALLNAPRLPQPSPDVTYFDAFGLILIIYPVAWGWIVLALTVALFALAAVRSDQSASEFVRGAGVSLGLMLASGILLFAANLLSQAGRATNYYDRLAAIPRLTVMGALLAAAVLSLALAWLRRSSGDGARTASGLATPLMILALAAQLAAPVIAFELAWPLLLAGVAAAASTLGASRAAKGLAVVATAVGLGWLLAQSFFLYQGIGPDLPWVTAIPLGLIAPLLAPLVPPVRLDRVAAVSAALALGGIAIAVWTQRAPLAPTVPSYSITHYSQRFTGRRITPSSTWTIG